MTLIERELFKKHFNRGGYVLDFSTDNFDRFTLRIVGVPLCQKYELSKGKSLGRFLDEASEKDAGKLCSALLDYEEMCFPAITVSAEELEQRKKLRLILSKQLTGALALQSTETSTLKKGPEYVRDLAIRAKKDFEDGNYDSTLTKARSLLEEAFCFAIESRGKAIVAKGQIKKLEDQFKKLYGMQQCAETDARVNDLLNGLGKIVSSIRDLRNISGDAHGHGSTRYKITKHHAKLCLNAASIAAEFIFDVTENFVEQNHF